MAKETVEERLERLLTVDAIPVINSALNHRRTMINAGDREDLRAQVLVRLLRKLTGEGEPIQNFEDYVATVTYHVVDDYVRATNPAGAMMANRLRYLCRHDPRFAMWEVAGETIFGLAEWKGQPAKPVTGAVDPNSLVHPVALKDVLARQPSATVFEFTAEDSGFRQVETRQLLGLLLSIRDSKSTTVLPHLGTVEEIAAIIGWEPAVLAAVWNDLPLEDDRIAAMLSLTRQQVINLRKSARARLTRRMEQW